MSDMNIDVETLLDKLANSVASTIENRKWVNPFMVGIHTGGTWIAKELQRRLGFMEALGELDISFYRDDFSQIGVQPQVRPSNLPFDVEERDILLIDDVLYTGRTVRAALNEIFDYGRPACVVLGVLIERDGRQIPIQADCVGARIDLKSDQRIKLIGPDPLQLRIQKLDPENHQT